MAAGPRNGLAGFRLEGWHMTHYRNASRQRVRARPAMILLALCLALPGCATYSLADTAPPGFARLTFVTTDGAAPRKGYDGLQAIGTTPIEPPGRDAVWVRPGKRAVGYVCPGVIFMDWPPTVAYTFESGGRYELVCDRGKGSIRPLP